MVELLLAGGGLKGKKKNVGDFITCVGKKTKKTNMSQCGPAPRQRAKKKHLIVCACMS